jgi:hypothetical protein
MIVVETGTGANPAANSFASVVDADAYYASRANAEWSALTTAAKEAGLILATDYLQATYSEAWKGEIVRQDQPLAWPRFDAYMDGYEIASNIVPQRVTQATIELALRTSSGPLIIDQDQRIVREKVDVVETEYAEFSDPAKRFPAVGRILSPLLRAAGNSSGGVGVARLVRA